MTVEQRNCLICEHWKPRDHLEMAKHLLARCGLGPAWKFFPPHQTCDRHKSMTETAVAARIEWADRKTPNGKKK